MIAPHEFAYLVSAWGSYMHGGDPGACLYGFDSRGVVQSEEHRADCIEHLNTHCRESALLNDDPAEDQAEIDQLIAYLRTAPVG